MSIAGDGYVFVPKCVSDSALCALRSEADHLFHLKKAQDALSEDEYLDKVRRFCTEHDGVCPTVSSSRRSSRTAAVEATALYGDGYREKTVREATKQLQYSL